MNRTVKAALIATALVGTVVVPVTTSAASAAAPSHTTPGHPVLTDPQRRAIVGKFATAVVHDDHAGFIASTTSDFVWTIPGHSRISGRTTGRGDLLGLLGTFDRYQLTISMRALTFGADTVAVEVHDTGSYHGKKLDQDVVNVLTIRDGKVSSADGNFADVAAFDAYFA
jgi:ketosteroid isomerase-like protein